MMVKLAKKSSPKIPVSDYIREYVALRQERGQIDKRMSEISAILKEFAAEKGQRDDKGSSYFQRDGYSVGNVARKSISFDVDKATKFFRKRGYPECIKTVEVIDSDAVNELVSTGEITMEDLEKITTMKVSYSIDIKPVEEVTDEVEQTTVSSPKMKLRGRGQ